MTGTWSVKWRKTVLVEGSCVSALAKAFMVIATACQSNSSAPFPVTTFAMKRKSPLSLYPRRAYPFTMVSTCCGR